MRTTSNRGTSEATIVGYQAYVVSIERYSLHCHVTTFRNFHRIQLGQNAYRVVRFAPFDNQCC